MAVITATSGCKIEKIILQTLVAVITTTSVCKMILPPLVLVNGQKWVYSFAKELNKTQKQCNNDTFSWTTVVVCCIEHSFFSICYHNRAMKNSGSAWTSPAYQQLGGMLPRTLKKGSFYKVKQDWKGFQSISASSLLRLWTNKIK